MKFDAVYVYAVLSSLEWRPGLVIKKIPVGLAVVAEGFSIHIICEHAHIEIGTHRNNEYQLVTYIPAPCMKTKAFSHCLKWTLDQILNHDTHTV